MRTEKELLIECLVRLNHSNVPYMIVGSMAGNFWGIPRTTHDLDFVIALQPADVDAFAKAFEGGFFLQVESIRNAFSPPFQFNVVDQESALKVDFWLQTQDAFDLARFQRRLSVILFDTPAWITTAEDLILQKLRWNQESPSERQLLDAAGVYFVQSNLLDVNYLRHWASQLGVSRELQSLFDAQIRPKST